MTIKRFFLTIFSIIILFSFTGCKQNAKIEYDEENQTITLEDGKKYIQTSKPWRLNSFTRMIGEIKHKNESYKLYANDGDNVMYIELVKSSNNTERQNLFVRSDLSLPEFENIKDYYVYYNNKGYNYNIIDYYLKKSEVKELDAPFSKIAVDIKVKKYNNVYYTIYLYQKDGSTYIETSDSGYVELPKTFIF